MFLVSVRDMCAWSPAPGVTCAGRRGEEALKVFLKMKRKERTVLTGGEWIQVSHNNNGKGHGCDSAPSRPRVWTSEDPSLGVTVQQFRALQDHRKLKLKASVNL